MKRIKHIHDFQVDQAIETVFPLFSAEGEKYWVPGWDYENIMESTRLHEDYIFVTRTHDHAASDAIWLVKTYDPDSHLVVFYKVEPKEKVGIITVKCDANSKSTTRVNVAYEYIALSESGNEFVAGFTSETYRNFIQEWKFLLEKYFQSRG